MARAAAAWVLASCVGLLVSCGPSPGGPDAGRDAAAADAGRDAGAEADAGEDAGGAMDAGPDAGPPVLRADAGPSLYAYVGEEVTLDGSGSTLATTYRWNFGNGEGWPAPRPEAVATVVYAAAGRYTAVLTVYGEGGARRSDSALISVTERPVFVPRESTRVLALPDRRVAVASPDADEVALFSYEGDRFERTALLSTARAPRTLALFGDRLAVACQEADRVQLFSLADPAAPPEELIMPRGSRPYGVVADEAGALYVSLQATGRLLVIREEAGALRVVADHLAVEDARGLSLLPDGRVMVTRWRSPDGVGLLVAVDPASGARAPLSLALDPQPPSDTESGGVPTYLEQALVSPEGRALWVPSLQAAIHEGTYRTGRRITHESTVRAALNSVDLVAFEERFESRKLFDDRGFASAGVLSRRGDYLFVAMRGSRAVERFDALSGVAAGSILDVGYAPDGLALSEDDRLLFVHASLSRELVVYDVTDFSRPLAPLARLSTVSEEPLDPVLLRGAQLFNDSFDTRIARDSYVACAHCHLEGQSDRLVWDFTDRGEGLRNTHSLLGRAGIGDGPLHWSANFDEVQDFEHDIRGPFAGLGLMRDEDFFSGTHGQTLGDPKAGLSADLDALAAYVSSLVEAPRSPFRAPDGSLTAAAARGRALFESPAVGCAVCHAGPRLTDSGFLAPAMPRLHDVGTLRPSSGGRLGGPLPGIDTPSLIGIWNSPPYLHDGSAATLREVITARNVGDQHGATSGLSEAELDDLEAYLREL